MSTTDNIKHAQINDEHHRQYKTCTDSSEILNEFKRTEDIVEK